MMLVLSQLFEKLVVKILMLHVGNWLDKLLIKAGAI
jgi:hypothetical protein